MIDIRLIFIVIFFSAASAGAERAVFCDSVPLQDVDWYENFTLPKFDPNLGELKAVDIELEVNLTQRLQMENTGQGNFSINSTTESVLTLLMPQGEKINANASLAIFKVVGPYDEAVDFSAPSSINSTESSSSGVLTYSIENMSSFVAGKPGESVVLEGVMKCIQDINAIGSISLLIRTKAGASVCVVYHYNAGAS